MGFWTQYYIMINYKTQTGSYFYNDKYMSVIDKHKHHSCLKSYVP